MNEKAFYKLKMFIAVFSLIVFALVMIWLMVGLNNADSVSAEQKLESVKQTVTNGAVLCYSIEGFYPETLTYLEQNYGVYYDKSKYRVHYRYVSADIRPTVSVYETE